MESYPGIASIGDIGRAAPGRTAPSTLTSDSDISSPGKPGPSIPSTGHTRSHGKAKNTKDIRKVLE